MLKRLAPASVVYAKEYAEATIEAMKEQYEDEKQLNVVDNNMTLDEWFDIWLRTVLTY